MVKGRVSDRKADLAMERHAQCGGSEPSIHRFQNDVRLGARCVASSEMGSQKKTSGPSPGEMQKGAPVPSSPKASSPRRVLLPVAQAAWLRLTSSATTTGLVHRIRRRWRGKGSGTRRGRSPRAQPRHHRVWKAWPGRTDGSHRQLRGQHSNRKEARAKPATGCPACKSPHHTRHERSRRQEAVPV
jgi:hypothetical protein